jgi:hypothetical protein
MNILLFVTTLLMALAIATYAQLGNFLDLAMIRQQHQTFMLTSERDFANDAQVSTYIELIDKPEKKAVKKPKETDAKVDENTPATESKNEIEEIKAQRALDIGALLNPEMKGNESYTSTFNIAKRLIIKLYGKSRFFTEAIEKDPDIVDRFLNQLVTCGGDYMENHDGQLPNKKNLSKLDLCDPKLQELGYLMLQGTKGYNPAEQPQKGYPSLAAYLKSNKEARKIKVFLTSPEMLEAIFEDPSVVESIITERERLSKAVRRSKEPMTNADATREFTELFGNHKHVLDESILDFGVTKTSI